MELDGGTDTPEENILCHEAPSRLQNHHSYARMSKRGFATKSAEALMLMNMYEHLDCIIADHGVLMAGNWRSQDSGLLIPDSGACRESRTAWKLRMGRTR